MAHPPLRIYSKARPGVAWKLEARYRVSDGTFYVRAADLNEACRTLFDTGARTILVYSGHKDVGWEHVETRRLDHA